MNLLRKPLYLIIFLAIWGYFLQSLYMQLPSSVNAPATESVKFKEISPVTTFLGNSADGKPLTSEEAFNEKLIREKGVYFAGTWLQGDNDLVSQGDVTSIFARFQPKGLNETFIVLIGEVQNLSLPVMSSIVLPKEETKEPFVVQTVETENLTGPKLSPAQLRFLQGGDALPVATTLWLVRGSGVIETQVQPQSIFTLEIALNLVLAILFTVYVFRKQSMRSRERAASLVEFALLIALISVVAMGAVKHVGKKVSCTFADVVIKFDPSTMAGMNLSLESIALWRSLCCQTGASICGGANAQNPAYVYRCVCFD